MAGLLSIGLIACAGPPEPNAGVEAIGHRLEYDLVSPQDPTPPSVIEALRIDDDGRIYVFPRRVEGGADDDAHWVDVYDMKGRRILSGTMARGPWDAIAGSSVYYVRGAVHRPRIDVYALVLPRSR